MAASLLFLRLTPLFSKKTLLYFSVLSCGLSTLLFGLLDHIPSNTLYVAAGSGVRAVTGFMSGGCCTLLFSLVPLLYPGRVTQMAALFEVAYTSANMGGTLLGGLLFKFCGFPAPFLLLGALILLLGLPIVHRISSPKETQPERE